MNKKLIVLSAICLVFPTFGCDGEDDVNNGDVNQAGVSGAAGQAEATGGAGVEGEGGAAGDGGASGDVGDDGDAGAAGDSGVDDSCQFESCGGDIAGNWNFDRTCSGGYLDENSFDEFCPAATLEFAFTVSGTISFEESGRYARNMTTGGAGTVTVPADCLQANLTCEDLETALSMTDPDDPDATPLATTCTQDIPSDPCLCVIELEERVEMEVGAYATEETRLTFIPDEGQEDADSITAEYCVQGDSLKVQIPGDDEDPAQIFVLSR